MAMKVIATKSKLLPVYFTRFCGHEHSYTRLAIATMTKICWTCVSYKLDRKLSWFPVPDPDPEIRGGVGGGGGALDMEGEQ